MGRKTRYSKAKDEREDTKRNQNSDNEEDINDDDEEIEVSSKNNKVKVGTKISEEDNEYEVEFIVEDRIIKGKTQYRVRWKGFPSSQDTWEDEDNLDCEELVNQYLNNKEKSSKNYSSDESNQEEENDKNKKGKKRPKERKKKSAQSKQKRTKTEVTPDENGEYVVSRILDMHVSKNGKHEYLVLWKGFPQSESSWEPEENVKETTAFEKFIKRLEEAKSTSVKQLRVSRRPTDRFTLTPPLSSNRRLSRRFVNKQRAKYYEAE